MATDPRAAANIEPAGADGGCSNGCRGNLVTITMEVRGTPVTMTSCSTCDRRSWNRSGAPIDLRSLLDEIRNSRPLRKAG